MPVILCASRDAVHVSDMLQRRRDRRDAENRQREGEKAERNRGR